jgi:hypothetical protein
MRRSTLWLCALLCMASCDRGGASVDAGWLPIVDGLVPADRGAGESPDDRFHSGEQPFDGRAQDKSPSDGSPLAPDQKQVAPVSVTLTVACTGGANGEADVSWSSSSPAGVQYCEAFIGGTKYTDTSPSGGPQKWLTWGKSVSFTCHGNDGGSQSATKPGC